MKPRLMYQERFLVHSNYLGIVLKYTAILLMTIGCSFNL